MSDATELQDRLRGPIDGALQLLDRQLLDCEGRMLGKVDDVELGPREDGALVITGLLTGPAALLARPGGRLGEVLVARWVQLRIAEPHRARPWRIDMDEVDRLDSALHLAIRRDAALRRGGEAHRLGALAGMEVRGPDGRRAGRVLDARFEPDAAGQLVLRSLIVGHGRLGSLLGYDRRDAQGPWLVRAVVRRLHSHTVIVGVDAAEIAWDARTVRLLTRPRELRESTTQES
jgi:sporulation protein YlmC with PRC-barrel domain